jgi:hypothetical protein
LLALLLLAGQETATAGARRPAPDYTLSGPYRHENLTVFLIHSKDRFRPGRLLTLEEALRQKKAIVHETGQVNELQVENVSADTEVFVQSGDIVKGGRQDRLISFDLLLPPRSGRVPVASCCVEQGRWQQRGKETVARFATSTGQLPSKMLKIHGGNYGQFGNQGMGQLGQFGNFGQVAQPGQPGNLGGQFGLAGRPGVRVGGQLGNLGQFGQLGQLGQLGVLGMGQLGGQLGNQGGVWQEVSQLQQKLQARLGTTVQSKESQASLQLTLEHPKVQQAVENYTRELSGIASGKKDVIGYAFAVNGKVNSVEVYGNAELFAKLWPKLLKANALEAFLEEDRRKTHPTVNDQAVHAVLRDAETGQATVKDVSRTVRVQMRETTRTLLFETYDRRKGTWVHKSYLTK